MAEAGTSEHARVDALVACSQRNVWVATWEPTSPSFRTLEHDDGHTALPVFSDEWELDRAAESLEWNRGSFRVARREIPARDAMRHVLQDQLGYFVVDVASEHCVEATRAEIEPLAIASDRSSSQGPFAAVGRITSTMIEAVRTSHAPTGVAILGGRESSHPPSAIALPGSRVSPPPPEPPPPPHRERSEPTLPAVPPPKHRVESSPTMPSISIPPPDDGGRSALAPSDDAVPTGDAGVSIVPMTGEPPDAWLDAYAAALKQFPEVEWACFCLASIGDANPTPQIAVRVDPSFRQRVSEIGLSVAQVSASLQVRVGTLLVDEPQVLKDARAEGVPFLPWRRRRSSPFTPTV